MFTKWLRVPTLGLLTGMMAMTHAQETCTKQNAALFGTSCWCKFFDRVSPL